MANVGDGDGWEGNSDLMFEEAVDVKEAYRLDKCVKGDSGVLGRLLFGRSIG